jgi:hypothetical protein
LAPPVRASALCIAALHLVVEARYSHSAAVQSAVYCDRSRNNVAAASCQNNDTHVELCNARAALFDFVRSAPSG